MAKRASLALLLFCLFGSLCANAQLPQVQDVCPYRQHTKSLACLIPDVTVTGSDQSLIGFNTAIAQVLGQLPLAAPVSGVVIGFNKKLAVPEDITENLGTILTERGNTVGKYKLFAGFTYQRFVFDTVDGTRLSNIPIVFSQPATQSQAGLVGYAQNALSANITQYTGIVAFGLTDRIDVSAIIPFERISASSGYNNLIKASTANCNYQGQANVCGPSTLFLANNVTGSASGFGDVILVTKATVISGERSKLAVGVETRLPTGDVFNLLGTGAYGVKPYVVFSRFWGRVTPHVNVGYQWNGFSVLRLNPAGGDLRLPDILDYSAGADVGIVKRKLSFVADFVAQHYFNAPRITPAAAVTGLRPDSTPIQGAEIKSIGVANSSYDVDNMSVGIKWSPKGNLIVSANALLKLNDAGLRSKFVPLAGISYRFGH